MKKIILVLISLFLIVGCGKSDTAAEAVEKYFNDYKSLADNVLEDLDELVKKEELTDDQKEVYKDLVKRQYRDLNYTIENEDYNGDTAKVTVKISYDAQKYLDYKLDLMKKAKETVTYNIVLNTIKVDGKYQVEQPNNTVLEKIHGIYNYEESMD